MDLLEGVAAPAPTETIDETTASLEELLAQALALLDLRDRARESGDINEFFRVEDLFSDFTASERRSRVLEYAELIRGAAEETESAAEIFARIAREGTLAERLAEVLGGGEEQQIESLRTRINLLRRELENLLEAPDATRDQISYVVGRLRELESTLADLQGPTGPNLRAEVLSLAFDAMREIDRDLTAVQIPGLLPQQLEDLRRGIREGLEGPTTTLQAEVVALAYDAMREIDRDLGAEAQILGLLPQQIAEVRQGIREALERPTTRLQAEVLSAAFTAMQEIDRDLSAEARIPGLLPQQLVELRRGIEEALERPTTRLRAEVYTLAFDAMRQVDRDLSGEAQIPGLLPQQIAELRRGIDEALERPTTRLRAEVYTLAFDAMREIERDLSTEADIPGLLPQQLVELRRGIEETLERPTTRLRAEVYALAFDAMREIERDLSAEAQIPGLPTPAARRDRPRCPRSAGAPHHHLAGRDLHLGLRGHARD